MEGRPATGLPDALTSVSPIRAYLRMAVGVPIWNLGVIMPTRSALAAFVRPLGVLNLARDARPVVAVDAELVTESSKLCDGGWRADGGGTVGFIVDAGFFARIEFSTLGVCSWPADRLRRDRALAESKGPSTPLFFVRLTAW